MYFIILKNTGSRRIDLRFQIKYKEAFLKLLFNAII